MSSSYASLCFLSYNRPEFLQEAISTAAIGAGFPLEIIVHDDGSAPEVQLMLMGLLGAGQISKLICNPPGENQGVGEAVRVAFEAASGDFLIKADQDLLFHPDWLAWAVSVLRRERDVGMAGWFHYHHEPVVSAKKLIAQHDDWQEHEDFVSSAFIVRQEDWGGEFRDRWETHSAAFAEDIMLKEWMRQARGFKLALPDEDLITNRGFGIGPSTVVPAPGQVATIHDRPVIFNG